MVKSQLKKLSNERLVEAFDSAVFYIYNYNNSRREIKRSTLEKAEKRYELVKEELLERLNGGQKNEGQ